MIQFTHKGKSYLPDGLVCPCLKGASKQGFHFASSKSKFAFLTVFIQLKKILLTIMEITGNEARRPITLASLQTNPLLAHIAKRSR